MNHLIIYAHPSEDSFSNELLNHLSTFLKGEGNNVVVSDLYAIGFNPILSADEIANLKKGIVADDVALEQAKINQADVISLVYPLWWASFPAILKGYIDRVISYGFGYVAGEKGIEGLLTGKKVLLHTSMGNSIELYKEKNLLESFTFTQGHEVFGFCGMDFINHFFYPKITNISDDEKAHFYTYAIQYYKDHL